MSKTNRSAPDLKATDENRYAEESQSRRYFLALGDEPSHRRVWSAQWTVAEHRLCLYVHVSTAVQEQRQLITHPNVNHLHPPVGQKPTILQLGQLYLCVHTQTLPGVDCNPLHHFDARCSACPLRAR
nr:hypothetical protein [Sphaerisporangium perillae]